MAAGQEGGKNLAQIGRLPRHHTFEVGTDAFDAGMG